MDKERSQRVYERLEKAITAESCTLEEAENAVGRLRETYFRRKPYNIMKNISMQEIAESPDLPL